MSTNTENIFERGPGKLEIFLKSYKGESFKIFVSDSMSVSEISKQLTEKYAPGKEANILCSGQFITGTIKDNKDGILSSTRIFVNFVNKENKS